MGKKAEKKQLGALAIDLGEGDAVSGSDLDRLKDLAMLLVAKGEHIKEIEAELKEQKAILLRLQREEMPDLFKEVGLTEIKLDSGEVVSVKADVATSITEENRAAAAEWLVENDFGGLMKTAVTTQFDRSEKALAEEHAQSLLKEFGEKVLVKEIVHPQTLKSFVKEQLEGGNKLELPLEVFGVHQFNVATVKAVPKKRKK